MVVAALTGLLGACGGNATSTSATASPSPSGGDAIVVVTPSPTATATPPPTASDVLAAALAALGAKPGYRVVFAGSDRYGPAAFDLVSNGRGALVGTIQSRGLTAQVLLARRSLYVRGAAMNAALLAAMLAPPPPPDQADNWLLISSAPPGNGFFDSLANPAGLLDCMRDTSLRAEGTGEVNGATSSHLVTGRNANSVGSLDVVAGPAPALVRWTITSEQGTQSIGCPGGGESGASAGLLTGTLDFTALTSADIPTPPANPYLPIPPDTFSGPQPTPPPA